jgi:cytochrome c oxidase assembly factor CtaG
MHRLRTLLFVLTASLFTACGTGIDAGGESLGENGGVAWILMSTMLIVIALVLWWIMGRED